MKLSTKQEVAFDALKLIGMPCGLNTILSKCSTPFDSKAQLKEVLSQLVALNMVTLQSNSQYKVSVIAKVQQKKAPTKQKAKSTKTPTAKVIENKPDISVNQYVSSSDTELKETNAQNQNPLPNSLEHSLASLEQKLSKGELSIHELPLKIEVLQRLSLLLSEDISDVLSNIAKDLIEANTAAQGKVMMVKKKSYVLAQEIRQALYEPFFYQCDSAKQKEVEE